MPSLNTALFSDLHREFYNSNNGRHRWFWNDPAFDLPNADDADFCVLPGDITAGNNAMDFVQTFCDRFKHVLQVAGNHEHYGAVYEDVIEKHRSYAAKVSNYHFLERDTVTLEGQRFVGCTMWYKGNVFRDRPLNDFFRIKMQDKEFGDWVFDYGAESVQWLYDTVESDDVVVTHMLPCSAAVDDNWRGDPLNCYYYNNADKVIDEKRPKLWLHGHTHSSLDKTLGDTRIVRNPRGYPGEINPTWQPNLRMKL